MTFGEFREIDDTDEEDLKALDTLLTPEERERMVKEYVEITGLCGDLSEGTTRGPTKIESYKIRKIVAQNETKEWNLDTITTLTEKLCAYLLETMSRIVYSDLRKDSGLRKDELLALEKSFRQNHASIERSVRERLGLDIDTRILRVGISEGRIYIWTPSQKREQLSKMYGEIYFYFRDKDELTNYINELIEKLDESKTGIYSETIGHLEKLMMQIFLEDGKSEKINMQLIRIKGEHLEFLNDLSGQTLKALEGRISRICTASGKGGISNPRFPEDEELIEAISRLTATVVSDCTIEPNGVIKYGEPELSRIERVVENLRKFGDITPTSRYIENEGHYLTHFPSVLGKALMFLGLPAGDKTIQNPSLFPAIKDGSDRVQRGYFEDMLPQDGCIGERMIIWTRANVLHAGDKTEKYGFEPRVGEHEIDLIQNHGKRSKKGYSLSWGRLDDLTMHSDERIAYAASNLQKIVWENPNRLIHDETEIARNLGIDVVTKPYMVRYYPKSGRVSVAWNARTSGIRDCVKLGILAPPNDTKKKGIVRTLLRGRPNEVRIAIEEIEDMGLKFEYWWE